MGLCDDLSMQYVPYVHVCVWMCVLVFMECYLGVVEVLIC